MNSIKLLVLGISEEELMNLFTPYGEVITKNILKVTQQIKLS